MALDDLLRSDAQAMAADLTELRHRIHRNPEVGLQLPKTQAAVLEAIDGLGLEVSTGTALSSVVAVLRGATPGPTTLLRGDMDALPLQEETGLSYASEIDGAMHACGHDLHTTMLVGAARLLTAHRDALRGNVVFMFQPGEEGWDGAGHMIAEGVLDASGERATSAYGMHVQASVLPRGTFSTRPGALLAGSDSMHVSVVGKGGHGASPHMAADPVVVAAEMVRALQIMVTRQFDIWDPVVVTVGSFHAGTRENIIPDNADFHATIRTFSSASRAAIKAAAIRLCRDMASAYGMRAEIEYRDEYPVTMNAPEHAAFAAEVVQEVFGPEHYRPQVNPKAAAEDFSRVLEEVPGCYLMLGAHQGDSTDTPSGHSPRAAFSDDVIPVGVLLHAQLAIRALERDSQATGDEHEPVRSEAATAGALS